MEAITLIYSLAGLIVGLMVGMTGVGGGAIMTPILMLGFGVAPVIAVGTDLVYAAVTKFVGMMVHGFKGSVDWPKVAWLSLGSVPACLIALTGLSFISDVGALDVMITRTLAMALILTACVLIFREKILAFYQRYNIQGFVESQPYLRPILTVVAGALLGLLVTVSSVGAGALGAMFLFLLYPRMPALRVVGTDIAHAVPLTTLAGLGHWSVGNVDVTLLLSLLMGSVPGIVLGAKFAHRVSDKYLRPIMAFVFFGVGLRFLF